MASPPREHDREEHAPTQDDVFMHDEFEEDDLPSFVDMQDFSKLVARTSTIEKNLRDINENVTKLTEMLKQLVHQQALSVPVDVHVGGNRQVSPKLDRFASYNR